MRSEVPEPLDEVRTLRQRASDSLPMAMVAAVCFALGLSLRAGGTSGPAPAFPIWTLFLALGCIAMLGAGASWVVGGTPTAPTSVTTRTRAARASSPDPILSPSGDPRSSSWLGDPDDDAYPPWNEEPHLPIMSKRTAPRNAMASPPPDPLADLAEPGDVAEASAHQVIEEIDRLVTDLKPAPTRGRPSA